MDYILSQIGVFSIFMFLIYVCKKIFEHTDLESEIKGTKTLNDEEGDIDDWY